MYSPFRNEQGQPKSLDEVAYADLAQLKDLEEGFALEFKRTWNENVRAKIPKIIASFANSHGGWLVIGIADDNKTVCPVPKQSADFSDIRRAVPPPCIPYSALRHTLYRRSHKPQTRRCSGSGPRRRFPALCCRRHCRDTRRINLGPRTRFGTGGTLQQGD